MVLWLQIRKTIHVRRKAFRTLKLHGCKHTWMVVGWFSPSAVQQRCITFSSSIIYYRVSVTLLQLIAGSVLRGQPQ